MRTTIETVQSLKSILAEIFFNKTNKVTKISNESVLNGILYGNAKISQKALKDIAIIESELFPDSAVGIDLDIIAERQGVAPRFGASRSSAILKIFADQGTQYLANTHVFKSTSGIEFSLIEDFTMSNLAGYDYVKVRSVNLGSETKAEAATITKVSPKPSGHKYVVNEYKAEGGDNKESDEAFRKRIKEAPNYLTAGTLNKLTQVFIRINSNILKVIYTGVDSTGKVKLSVATQNGVYLTQDELNDIVAKSNEYLSLTDQKMMGNQVDGLVLSNVEYEYVDIDFRVDLSPSISVDKVRSDIQSSISKYLDFRFWDYTRKVEWDNLLDIVKLTNGVLYVADEYFYPKNDLTISKGKLPRARGFIMRNLQGSVIVDTNNNINPVYYQNSTDKNFSLTVLGTI